MRATLLRTAWQFDLQVAWELDAPLEWAQNGTRTKEAILPGEIKCRRPRPSLHRRRCAMLWCRASGAG